MSVQNTIVGAVILWFLIYLFVYYTLYNSHSSFQHEDKIKLTKSAFDMNSRKGLEFAKIPLDSTINSKMDIYSITLNPVISTYCESLSNSYDIPSQVATVVIPYKENIGHAKEDLLQTIQSILRYSNGFLKKIIIIDDHNLNYVAKWPEWSTSTYSTLVPSTIEILRTDKVLGLGGAKNHGATAATKSYKVGEVTNEILLFIEPAAIVSKNWIGPLYSTIKSHSKSIVYPSIDVIDRNKKRLYKSSNVVAGFDWSFNLKWEEVITSATSSRFIGQTSNSKSNDEDTLLSSPSTPTTFGISFDYYMEIGGFVSNLADNGIEIAEFSIRVWTCGGVILRQPCSRVAIPFYNVDTDYNLNYGTTKKADIDRSAMSIADQWLDMKHAEYVYMSRFTNYIPYKVETPIDNRSPLDVNHVQPLVKDQCSSFNWFLKEIYPGLQADIEGIVAEYKGFLATPYEENILKPWIDQYRKESIFLIDNTIEAKLKERAERSQEKKVELVLLKYIPPEVHDKKPVNHPKTPEEIDSDLHYEHADRVKELLLCEDEILHDTTKTCSIRAKSDKSGCDANPEYMMFSCPKTCDLCAVGDDSKLCVDFYIKKCPEWKMEGKCESQKDYMNHYCRVTCGLCTSIKLVAANANTKTAVPTNIPVSTTTTVIKTNSIQESSTTAVVPEAGAGNVKIEIPRLPKIDGITQVKVDDGIHDLYIDPYIAQKKYADGKLPDPANGKYLYI